MIGVLRRTVVSDTQMIFFSQGMLLLGSNHFLKSELLIFFVAPPSNIITSSDQNVIAPAELTLNCSADGKPKPTITWTRVSDNTAVTMPLTISRGKNGESFRCTADNDVGKPSTKDVNINILCEKE